MIFLSEVDEITRKKFSMNATEAGFAVMEDEVKFCSLGSYFNSLNGQVFKMKSNDVVMTSQEANNNLLII